MRYKMQYFEIRPFIKSGDLIAFRGTGLSSWFVRWYTKSNYSHVGIAWIVGERILIIESRPKHKGITIDRLLSHALKDKPTLVSTDVNWNTNYEKRAFEKLGVSYSYLKDICAGLKLKLVGDGMECAEFASYVLQVSTSDNNIPNNLVNYFNKDTNIYSIE
jgi:hypothetical protein